VSVGYREDWHWPAADSDRPSTAAQNFSPLQPFGAGRSPYRPFNRRHQIYTPELRVAAFKQLKNSDIEVQKECSGESVNAIRTQSARMRGRLNKQIGADLGIAEKTVKVHRGRVMEKMQASSVAELVHMCDIIGIELPPHPR
jgi:hypothetical protein